MAAKSKWLAEMFHSFPHLDFDFQWTTTIFTPDDKGYIQALMFNGIILLFVAVALFIGFTLYFLICSCYFCSRCHPPLKPKPHKSRCLRLLISTFAFLSCVALGVGFYGNNKASSGVGNFASAAVDIYDTWDLFKIKNTVAKQYLQEGANSTVCDFISALKGKNMSIPASPENLARSVDALVKDLNISSTKLSRSAINLKNVADETVYYDNLRWWITIAIHFWHLLVVVVVFYSSWRERKYPFILLTMMSTLCLFYMSGSISIEVPFSIGAGDICIAPQDAIYQSVDDPADKVVISYYLNCWNKSANPLSRPYLIAQLRLQQIDVILNNVSKDPELQHFNETKYYLDQLAKFLANADAEISGLVKALDCTYINQRFNDGVNEVCFTVLDGLSLLILAALMLSAFLVSIIVCITPIWKSMARLKSILRKPGGGVTLVTGSYSGPPGREGLLNSSWDTSLDASYKSINEEQQGRTEETLPLVAQEEPPAYSAVHGSTEFLSVEEDRRRHLQAETEA